MALLFPDRSSLERSRVGGAGERYEYTPYGTRTIRVDLTPPAVEQLREAGGKLVLEFSEEILLQRVRDAIASGQLTLHDTTDDAPIAITADQPVRDGKQKGRRLLLTRDADPPLGANHGMLLHIEPGAIVDLFENRPEMAYEKAFVWLAADQAIDDTTPPRVDLLITKAGELEVGFSEEIDPQIASAAILLDGAPRTWTAMPDGFQILLPGRNRAAHGCWKTNATLGSNSAEFPPEKSRDLPVSHSLKMVILGAAALFLMSCSERLGCDAAIMNRSKETLRDVTFSVDGRPIRAGWLSSGAQAGFISVIHQEPRQAKVFWRTEGGAPNSARLLLPTVGSCAESHLTLWFEIEGPNQVTAHWEESPQ